MQACERMTCTLRTGTIVGVRKNCRREETRDLVLDILGQEEYVLLWNFWRFICSINSGTDASTHFQRCNIYSKRDINGKHKKERHPRARCTERSKFSNPVASDVAMTLKSQVERMAIAKSKEAVRMWENNRSI